MSEMRYAEGFTAFVKPCPSEEAGYLPYGMGRSGYGRKIATRWMVRFGDNPRLYRVYVCQFSNAGTAYVVKGGETLYFQACDFA